MLLASVVMPAQPSQTACYMKHECRESQAPPASQGCENCTLQLHIACAVRHTSLHRACLACQMVQRKRSCLVFLPCSCALWATSVVWYRGVTMATHPGISSFICSVNNPATVSPCASRTDKGRLFGDLFVPLLYGAYARTSRFTLNAQHAPSPDQKS